MPLVEVSGIVVGVGSSDPLVPGMMVLYMASPSSARTVHGISPINITADSSVASIRLASLDLISLHFFTFRYLL